MLRNRIPGSSVVKTISMAAIALAALVCPGPGRAAEPATIKVALIDMSAAIGMGMAGRGMRGGQTMPDGWGRDGELGGWMGPGMMGHGAMPPGMMSIRTDHASIAAGPVRFDVTNWSKSMLHEMLVVAVDEGAAPLPYDYATGRVVEDQVHVLGETKELPPNASAALDLELPAGTYLLICNLPGHYAAGMATPLAVTP